MLAIIGTVCAACAPRATRAGLDAAAAPAGQQHAIDAEVKSSGKLHAAG
ncbi:MAG TPA: hypothetical protein PLO41_02020 [Rubrivivax sp.]|nr:hypothetical protein [Rubrivivax sp.]